MRGQRGAEAANVDIVLVEQRVGIVIIPPHHLLTDPTGDGERDFAVALASGRGFQFCDPLFKIGAAVVAYTGPLKILRFPEPQSRF